MCKFLFGGKQYLYIPNINASRNFFLYKNTVRAFFKQIDGKLIHLINKVLSLNNNKIFFIKFYKKYNFIFYTYLVLSEECEFNGFYY